MSYDLEDKSRLWRIFGGVLLILLYISPTAVGIHLPIATYMLVCIGLVCLLGIGLLVGYITITLRDIAICLCLIAPFACIGIVQFFAIHETAGIKSLVKIALNLGAALAITKYFSWHFYTKILRCSMPLNIGVIILVLLLGTLTFDPMIRTDYDPGLAMEWKNFHLTILPGSELLVENKVRVGGIFGHANFFGIVSTMGLLGLYMGKERVGLASQFAWWFIFIISFLITESRAALLMALVFVVAYNMLQSWNSIQKVIKKIVIIGGIVGVSIAVTLMRFNENTGDITSGRAGIIDMVLNEVTNGLPLTQLLGVGLGNSILYLEQQYGFAIPVDNSYFKLLLEVGIIGTIMVLLSIGFLFWHYRHTTFVPKYVYWAFVLGLLAHSFFEADFMLVDIKSFGWILFLMYASQETMDDRYYRNCESSKSLQHI